MKWVRGHENLALAFSKTEMYFAGLQQELVDANQTVASFFATKMRHQRESFSVQYDHVALMRPRSRVGSKSSNDSGRSGGVKCKSRISSLENQMSYHK